MSVPSGKRKNFVEALPMQEIDPLVKKQAHNVLLDSANKERRRYLKFDGTRPLFPRKVTFVIIVMMGTMTII
jgi:hypothetical protein